MCALASAWAMAPLPARACGGFFCDNNASGVQEAAVAHRMAFAVGTAQTVLWDQIEYVGEPEGFVWVLPVRNGGNVQIDVADPGFFEALVGTTALNFSGPPLSCANPCDRIGLFSSADGGGSAELGDFGPPGGVTVYGEATVGPYETAIVGAESPRVLVDWLEARGYAIPPGAFNTIAAYVGEGFDFVALRLDPARGVQRMDPIRITYPGAGMLLPLKMVAVGADAEVALELFVFGEGRYETANFPTVEVDRDAVTYDFATNAFDYEAQFDRALVRAFEPAWVVENADFARAWEIRPYTRWDENGEEIVAQAEADWDIVVDTIATDPFLTRLRTKLRSEDLDRDLLLQPAASDAVIDRVVTVDRERNRPGGACQTVCTERLVPGATAAGIPGGAGDTRFATGTCTAGGAPSGALGWLALVGLAAALGRRRTRRRAWGTPR